MKTRKVRRLWDNEDWWFSVVDVVGALTDSDRPRKYWSDLKVKIQEEGSELSDKIGQLKLQSEDGKFRETDCANLEGVFRIIQSIPSPEKNCLLKVIYIL